MFRKLLIAAALVLSSQIAFAGVLTLEKGAADLEGVNISKGGTATVDSRTTPMSTIGAGLRKKLVFKVYVAQLLVSDSDKANFVRTSNGALASLDKVGAAAISMTFLRGVEAAKVQEAFNDALNANKVNLQDPSVVAFLDAVKNSGDADNSKTMTLVAEKLSNGKDAVTYESTKGKVTTVVGDAGFMKAVLSIWLGVPADSNLEKLKNGLLGLE